MEKEKSTIYETTLEMAFSFENKLNIKIKSLFFHFNRNVISNLLVRPYAIVFNDTNGNKYRYTMENIIKCLGYIPIYKLSKESSTEYNLIDINNKIISIPSTSPNISTLKEMDNESFKYETSIGINTIDHEITEMMIDILLEFNISFKETEKGIIIYNDKASYNILVPNCYRNMTDTGYCIIPSPHDFISTKSLGRFSFFANKDISQPTDYHLAIIKECPMCEQNIICDWQSFDGTICPYCGEEIDSNQ